HIRIPGDIEPQGLLRPLARVVDTDPRAGHDLERLSPLRGGEVEVGVGAGEVDAVLTAVDAQRAAEESRAFRLAFEVLDGLEGAGGRSHEGPRRERADAEVTAIVTEREGCKVLGIVPENASADDADGRRLRPTGGGRASPRPTTLVHESPDLVSSSSATIGVI